MSQEIDYQETERIGIKIEIEKLKEQLRKLRAGKVDQAVTLREAEIERFRVVLPSILNKI